MQHPKETATILASWTSFSLSWAAMETFLRITFLVVSIAGALYAIHLKRKRERREERERAQNNGPSKKD